MGISCLFVHSGIYNHQHIRNHSKKLRIAWKILKNIIIVTHKKVELENNATSLTYIMDIQALFKYYSEYHGVVGFSVVVSASLVFSEVSDGL